MQNRGGIVLGATVLLLGVMVCAVPFEASTWIFRDGRFYVNINHSILERGSLEDPFAHSWYNGELGWNRNIDANFSNIAQGRNGEFYHFRPYLPSFLALPLYWAFGLFGVLLFNLLGYAVAAFGIERFARHYAPRTSSMLAALALVLMAGPRYQIYNYSVDVLILAMMGLGAGALVMRRGFLAGLCIGGVILMKPPNVAVVLPCALVLWDLRDKKTFLHTIYGGAVSLGLGAAMNTYMFGRPWWFGYNRILAVQDGVQQLHVTDTYFVKALPDGAREMFLGGLGIGRRWAVFAPAVLGFVALARKHPGYVAGTVTAIAAQFILFSHFAWQHDRYMFAALALATPAAAAGFSVIVRGLMALARRARRRPHPSALLAALLAAGSVLAVMPVDGSPEARIGRTPYVVGALETARGVLDLRDAELPLGELQEAGSLASRTRFDTWTARTPTLAIVVAAPFAALGGIYGLLVLHLLCGALLAYALARLGARVAPPPLAAVVAVGFVFCGPFAAQLVTGGAELIAAAVVAAGALLAMHRRLLASAVLMALACWLADAFYLAFLVPVALAWLTGERRSLIRAAAGAGAGLGLYFVMTLLVLGRPFASPDDFVVVAPSMDVFAVSGPSLREVLEAATAPGHAARGLLLTLPLALVGAAIAARRDRLVALLIGATVLSAAVPGALTDGDGLSPLVLFGVGLGAAATIGALPPAVTWGWRRAQDRPRLAWAAVGAVAALLLVIGAARRGAANSGPLRLATPRGVLAATVRLDEIDCDFLAWELMSWECAMFDGGGDHRTGLRTPRGARAPGSDDAMLLIPTAEHRPLSTRTVRWTLPATDAFVLRAGPADGPYDGDATLEVVIDGEVRDTLEIGRDDALTEHRYDTSSLAGEVSVELRLRRRRGRSAAVAVDGGFE